MANAYFVTGTDTDVGKTLVSCALLRRLGQHGYSTAALKPVAAGCANTASGICNADALALQKAASLSLSYEQINPVALQPAIAPHIAAARAGVTLSAAAIARHCRQVLELGADYTVVEGAGGWFVPLNQTETLADVVTELQLPVILVVALRLGCLNHALLTVAAIEHCGLSLAAWVGNTNREPAMAALSENIDTLNFLLPAPCLGIVPHLSNATPELAENHLDLSGVMLNS